MASLVLLDFEGTEIKQPSRSAVAAARKLGDVHVLVAGLNIGRGRRGRREARWRQQGPQGR